MSCEDNGLIKRLSENLMDYKKENEDLKIDLETWTDALEELSEIEGAFKTNGIFKLRGKTVLDVGTDCVKPLFIALKFKPNKILGISDDLSLFSFGANLKQKSRLFAQTEIGLYNCSFFDTETFDRIMKTERMATKKFEFVLVSKTLHHLRDGKCVKKHKHREDEKCCKYRFDEEKIFRELLGMGKRVIICEFFDPTAEDDDKIRGRGGYFAVTEWLRILRYLSQKYEVKFVRPKNFQLHIEDLKEDVQILRQVDCICFYVEEQKPKAE